MTLVKIDIKNVASETHPDDKVIFRSPAVREAPGGGITSTAEAVVPLVDGIGEKELAPGPVIVTFQCRGIADTHPKRGTVPDKGSVPVADVIGGSLTYTPEVVSATQAVRDEAVRAAADAKVAEELAEGHAGDADNASNAASEYAREAKDYRDTVSGYAQTATAQAGMATDKASEANTSANVAGGHASAADTARQGAVTAQGLAENARDAAASAVQQTWSRVSAIEAMAGLAPESPVDGQTANLVEQPETLTRAAIDHRIDLSSPVVARVESGYTGETIRAAIVSALTAFPSSGDKNRTVYLPAGDYLVSPKVFSDR